MAESLVLGSDIFVLRVRVTTGSDFAEVLERQDSSGTPENWPVGTTVNLIIGGTAYPATLDDADAVWLVDDSVADTWADGSVAILKVVNGSSSEVWAVGTVKRLG